MKTTIAKKPVYVTKGGGFYLNEGEFFNQTVKKIWMFLHVAVEKHI